MEVGSKIKKIREWKNLTQEEMATKLNITQANYSKYEREAVGLSLNRLEEIAKALDVDTTDLLKSDERNVFLIQNNHEVSGVQGTVNNHYSGSNEQMIRDIYEKHVALMLEKIQWLEEKIKTLESVNAGFYPSVNDPKPGERSSRSK